MNKEVITNKQGIYLIVLFLTGTSTMLVYGINAKQDAWLAIILAIFMALFMALIHSRIHNIFLGNGLFDIIEFCFGRFIGKGIILLYTWYVLHTGSIVLRNIGQFITINSLRETPLIIPMIIITITSIWIIKQGIEVMGKMASFSLILFVSGVFITILLLLPNMNINNLFPVLYRGMKPVIRGAYLTFSFPFGEIIVFTMIFSHFKERKSPNLIFIVGLLIGGISVLIISLTGILVLGVNGALSLYYPSYGAIKRINIGNILQRLEVIIAIMFVVGGIFKVSIYLLATCRGIEKIFRCSDYRFIVIPIGLLMAILSYILYDSIMEFLEWDMAAWIYYSFFFQVILPVIIWITCEIKKRLKSN